MNSQKHEKHLIVAWYTKKNCSQVQGMELMWKHTQGIAAKHQVV